MRVGRTIDEIRIILPYRKIDRILQEESPYKEINLENVYNATSTIPYRHESDEVEYSQKRDRGEMIEVNKRIIRLLKRVEDSTFGFNKDFAIYNYLAIANFSDLMIGFPPTLRMITLSFRDFKIEVREPESGEYNKFSIPLEVNYIPDWFMDRINSDDDLKGFLVGREITNFVRSIAGPDAEWRLN